MKLKSENLEFQDKLMAGINKAIKKLLVESAEKNETMVVSYTEGSVQHIPAKDLLRKITNNE